MITFFAGLVIGAVGGFVAAWLVIRNNQKRFSSFKILND